MVVLLIDPTSFADVFALQSYGQGVGGRTRKSINLLHSSWQYKMQCICSTSFQEKGVSLWQKFSVVKHQEISLR